MKSTLVLLLSCCSKDFSTFLSVEKYTKSSTYRPRYNGALSLMIVPWKIQGAFCRGDNPIDFKIDVALSNQCLAELFRPYRERLSNQYVPGLLIGQPWGGLSTYFSSSGSVAWQNAYLKSPDFNICLK